MTAVRTLLRGHSGTILATVRIAQQGSNILRRNPSFTSSSALLSATATFQLRTFSDKSWQSRRTNDRDRNDATNELDIARPIDIQMVEKREYQIYTYQEFVELNEFDNKPGGTVKEQMDRTFANPWWILWALGLVALGAVYVVICIRIRREQLRFDPKMRAVKNIDSENGPSIGGPFTLTGVDGKTYTNEDFKGKWIFIYFGFTNCPDICPQEMAKMTRMITNLDKKVGKDYWQPLFVSIDPKRDTLAKVQEYLSDFHPRILGLTGTQDEVDSAAREYRVYYAVPDEQMTDEDYLVDHSIIMYLMDPEGKFCDYTTKEFTWFEIYSKLLRRMMDYERAKGKEAEEKGVASTAVRKVANVASVSDDSDVKGVGDDANRFGQHRVWYKNDPNHPDYKPNDTVDEKKKN